MPTFKQITEAQFVGNSAKVELMEKFDPEKTAETVCAFANRNGGVIYFGVREKKDGVMKALDEDFFRPGQRMLPVKEWREAALEFFSEQKPEIEFDVVDSHDKDFPILTIHTSEKRVTLLDGRSYFREGTKNVLLTPQTGRAQDTLEPHRALGDWIADDKILIADANMPVADANFPITSGDTRTDVEPKSEQPSKEPITTQAVGESMSTSTAMAFGEAITVGDAVSAAVSGDEEPATKVADDAVGSPRAVGDVSGTSQSAAIGMSISGHDPRQTSEQSASESERLSVTGRGLPTRWKATFGEECLNIDKYAKVIAALFRAVSETEQLCFGLFGHWGRGKTTMAKKVAAELESGGYQSITFSAWKYRTNPELWIHLYETVVKAAGHSNWFLPIRASFVRIGPWPAIFAIWAFFGALQTIGQSLGSLYSAIQWLGVAGLAYAAFLYLRIRSFSVRLKQLYWALPRHSEKLGMQATIGNDLKGLLLAWLPADRFHWERGSRPAWLTVACECRAAAFGYGLGCFLVAVQLIRMPLVESLNGILPKGFGITDIGWTGAIAAAVIWTIIAVAAPLLVYFPSSTTRKGFLIVDDLDRCHPDQMVEVMESLLLLLDDEEINRRLQLCVLVDEGVLFHALAKKYANLIKDNRSVGDSHKFDAQCIADENMEKFFFVHLRLNELSSYERLEVMRGVTPDLTPSTESNVKDSTDSTMSAVASDRISVSEDVKVKLEPAPVNLELSHDEAVALRNRTQDMTTANSRRRWGPRAIRSFKFRYMLARELLRELGEPPVDPQLLTEKLLEAMQSTSTETPESADLQLVDRVVNQVA